MGSSRERWSASNRDGGRDGGDGEGWSVTKGSSESASELKKKKSKFLAPECNCGAYAILFMSSILGNPNRLFYGCPYFKGLTNFLCGQTPAPHCNFFAWFDEYVASYGAVMSKAVYPGHGEQVEGQQCGTTQFDLKCKELNDRIIGLESHFRDTKHVKSGLSCISISFLVLSFVVGIVFANIIRVLG
ncbi:hypothetical protein PIB30_032330 [Stylosanthes scabra]|uniref:GRF-type domain-containing protein n=1 Tax=Stylosanthes scabra TaxID=79078 RepID=A0ABU6SBU5_9FABA|nr:hypothetical protein [Stylosanthes scabra]